MTEKEQRIAIAMACGWKEIGPGRLDERRWQKDGQNVYDFELPDYLRNLNAMHQAEETLKRDEQRAYTKLLRPKLISNLSADWCILHATATQRAEVFLRVKGLWKE